MGGKEYLISELFNELVFLPGGFKHAHDEYYKATMHPLAIILTVALWAWVRIILQGSIVALILPHLFFLL